MTVAVVDAHVGAELDAARELVAEYAAALGFREIAAYRYNPIAGTSFLGLAL